MADLRSDVIGQVARLPLKPSEANALLPLYQAISNSLHAITERFGDDGLAEKGRIDIEDENHPIIIRHMKCDKSIRPRGSVNNWMCFCANDRPALV